MGTMIVGNVLICLFGFINENRTRMFYSVVSRAKFCQVA